MNTRAAIAFVFVFVILLPSTVFPIEKPVIVTDQWPPFRIYNKNLEPTGIDIDLLRQLETKMNVQFEIKKVPWVRALAMMKKGQADIMVGLAKTPDRETFITYINPPYFVVQPALYALKERNIEIKNYVDLKRFLIGETRASAYFEPFDSDKSLNKYDVAQESQLIDMLVKKHVDVIIGTDPQVDYEIRQKGLDDLITKIPYQPKKLTQIYIGISKKSSFLARQNELERSLRSLIKDGTIKAITRKYLNTDEDASTN